jgi:outer membrane immunogenic protein
MFRAIASGVVVLLGIQTAAWGQTSGQRAQQAPAFTWTGFYVGAYAGGAWGDSDLRTDAGSVTATSYFQSDANINSVNQNGSGSLSPDAVIGGIQVGANLQTGNLVYGLEADFGAFDLNGSRGAVNVAYPTFAAMYTVRSSMDTDWLFTARARVGWTNSANLLIYATGGLAMTALRVSNSFSDDAGSSGLGGSSNTELKTGWTVGGGAEWALSRHWTLKAEYLHVNFGSASATGTVHCGPAGAIVCTTFNVTPSSFASSADLSAHIGRLGINFRF